MRKNKKQAQIEQKVTAVANEEAVENNCTDKKVFVAEETERDYFEEYYKAYKNDYTTQYLVAYRKLKEKQKAEGKAPITPEAVINEADKDSIPHND